VLVFFCLKFVEGIILYRLFGLKISKILLAAYYLIEGVKNRLILRLGHLMPIMCPCTFIMLIKK